MNQSLCRTLGFPPEELKKLTFQQITHPDDLNSDLQQLERLMAGEILTYTMEKHYFRKDGEIVWARLGDDEFGLLLPSYSNVDQVREVVQRIVSAVHDFTFIWQDRPYHVGASAGITQIDQYNCISNVVMSQADVAYYSAKHAGRGQYKVYQEVQG